MTGMTKKLLMRQMFRQEKRAQRLSFWVRRPPGGVGVFHAKGWWPKTSCPPSKLCFPWVSKRGIRDVPGILPGCPGPLAVFKKFVQKNFVRIFRSLNVYVPFLAPRPCHLFKTVNGVLEQGPWHLRALGVFLRPLEPRALPLGALRGFVREILNGVSADGVGVKFPIVLVNCSCLPWS